MVVRQIDVQITLVLSLRSCRKDLIALAKDRPWLK